ncbi:MAG: SGNH/GDSL hydrolase family protein [Phycisphaerae bacterium]|nr:SGNH/GDSL hydrolase family protein [Phycisphaerae bacterium]MDW8262263.1 SGNH/GDSL hydrolase family protein [Phycisphaerales bacterium]
MGLTWDRSMRLLFIGDSITDCDRRKDPEEVGFGYVRMVRDWLLAAAPATAPIVMNRGISGNKMPDLVKRWQRDAIEPAPDVLSVFIGINDVWHGLLPGREGCPLERFLAGYRQILSESRAANPSLRIVLCEPSALWLNDPPDADERLHPYIAAVHQIAREFSAQCVVRLHEAFAAARRARPEIRWTTDGVHPTSIGHALIARTWMADVCGL